MVSMAPESSWIKSYEYSKLEIHNWPFYRSKKLPSQLAFFLTVVSFACVVSDKWDDFPEEVTTWKGFARMPIQESRQYNKSSNYSRVDLFTNFESKFSLPYSFVIIYVRKLNDPIFLMLFVLKSTGKIIIEILSSAENRSRSLGITLGPSMN